MVLANAEGRVGLQFPNSTGELHSPIPRGIGRQFLRPPPGKLELWMKLSGRETAAWRVLSTRVYPKPSRHSDKE